jgi:hypothetical protein
VKERLLPQHMFPIIYSCLLTVEGTMEHVTGKSITERKVLKCCICI